MEQLSLLSFTNLLIKGLGEAQSKLGVSLRRLLSSPMGEVGIGRQKQQGLYPLPLPMEAREALKAFLEQSMHTRRRKTAWRQCELAWWGLVILSLNSSGGFTTQVGIARGPLQKEVLAALWTDVGRFVLGDGLSNEVVRGPDVAWSVRIPDLSVSYCGDVCEKARWLTWPQVEPGLPPVGKGGCLFAPDFCDEWVGKHLMDAELSRLDDSDVVEPLPFAVVRATQAEWETIGRALLERGVATVIEEKDIAVCRGEKILNGAFGVVKPGKWVGDPAQNKPVLRLIMDFRCANSVHRMLPGAVDSLVGPSKWQGLTLGPDEVLLSSGDDLVACFYLFRIPFSWSKYFAFRKPITRQALGLPGKPMELVYLASQVLPMGWAAAVTVVQHIHRHLALGEDRLPEGREIHRQRPLPEKAVWDDCMYWNLYIDDLTLLEVVDAFKVDSKGKVSRSPWQLGMEESYDSLGVPFSKEKATSRELVCEKLGALLDGKVGRLGVTTKRAIDFISLALFLISSEKVPTKWVQIMLGKYVHLLQFRRPLFSLVRLLWRRVGRFNAGACLGPDDVDEVFRLVFTLPLCYTDLRAQVSGRVTCSDASETGGGICASTSVTPLGSLGMAGGPLKASLSQEFLVIEWFAGIGGLSRALERLGLRCSGVAVCEQDPHCLAVLRKFLPGCEVWTDICKVDEKVIRSFFDRYPNARGVVQAGGSPCQGLSMLSTGRLHFDDPRSNLFFQLVRVNRLVEQEAHRRSMWHFGMVENVVCDSADQAVFRKETGWDQFLCCAGTISHVRRPRFFWLSSQNFDGCGVMSTPGCGYRTLYFYGKKEPPALWVSPGWSWVSQDDPVSLPTFTRAIPRVRPPRDPAGLYHSPPDAVERWKVDGHRYPPYTYKLEYCLTDGTAARVCGAAEREVLMGFMPGHTCAKRKGVLASQDMRCAAVGNSFHTGVVASILNCCLRPFLPHHRFPSQEENAENFHKELSLGQAEVYSWCADKASKEDTETWLDRLEQQSDAIPQVRMPLDFQLVARILSQCSYRGTDVHLDTLTFYRPDRLPLSSIDPRQWRWKVVKGWAWKCPNHINILEMEALYHTIKYRGRSLRLMHKRFLHLVDSQVVLGVAAKGRSSSLKLQHSLHKFNLLVLALHCYPVLGWVASALNPADAPSRWYEHQ